MLKKKAILLFRIAALLVWLPLSGYAQQSIDSLEQLLRENIPDTQRIKVINHLVYEYNDVNIHRALEISNEALKLVLKTNNKFDIGNAYLTHALALEATGKYHASLEYNRKALVVFESISHSQGMSAALNNIGIAYNQIGDYGLAVYHILRAIQIDESNHDTLNTSSEYINLAESYYKSKNFSPALQWAQRAFANATKTQARMTQGYAAEILAPILIEQNNFDSARYFIRFAQQVGKEFNNEYIIARCYGHLGNLFFKSAQMDSAKYYLKRTIELSQDKYLADVLLPAMITLANCYERERNWAAAQRQADDALTTSLRIKNNVLALESCTLLASIYHQQHRDGEAFHYLTLASSYKDTIMNHSITGSIDAKTFDFNLEKEKKEKQMAIANLQKRDEEVTRQRYILALAGVGLISLITILLLIRKSTIDRKVAYLQLTLKNHELGQLNQEVNGLINTIVHDLKSPLNSLQGIFYLMNLELKNKQDPEMEQLLKQGNMVLTSGYEIVKELLDLRELEGNAISINPQKFSLPEFLSSVQSHFTSIATQKAITLMVDVAEVEIESDRMLLKRVMDNLISNAIKFSPRERKVMITGNLVGDRIILTVADQGQGFQEKDMDKVFGKFQKLSARPTGGESSNGLGLAIVKLLVTRLKGTISLKTEWEKGSTFTIDLPTRFT